MFERFVGLKARDDCAEGRERLGFVIVHDCGFNERVKLTANELSVVVAICKMRVLKDGVEKGDVVLDAPHNVSPSARLMR